MGAGESKPRTAKAWGTQGQGDQKRGDGVQNVGSPNSKFGGKSVHAKGGMTSLQPEHKSPNGKAGAKQMSKRLSSSSMVSATSSNGGKDHGTPGGGSLFNDSAIEVKGLANTELKEEDKATAMMF
eukprot:m.104057 g.104057  ORF g.104057 m.104057 type:complete len:125 (-) comp20907_c0_seq1:229-603(-)